MKKKDDYVDALIELFPIFLLIILLLSSIGLIHQGMKLRDALIHREQIKKAEVNNRKEPIKKLYKDAFNEKR